MTNYCHALSSRVQYCKLQPTTELCIVAIASRRQKGGWLLDLGRAVELRMHRKVTPHRTPLSTARTTAGRMTEACAQSVVHFASLRPGNWCASLCLPFFFFSIFPLCFCHFSRSAHAYFFCHRTSIAFFFMCRACWSGCCETPRVENKGALNGRAGIIAS